MRPGPPRQPANLRLLRGNPGHRPVKPDPAKPAAGTDCPEDLTAVAKAEWERIAPELLRLGLLSELDRAALAAYCESYADFRWAVRAIKKNNGGRTLVSAKGYEYVHPAITVKRQAMEKIRQFAAEFGLSPSARGRMEIDPLEFEDPDEARFFGKRPPSPPPEKAR